MLEVVFRIVALHFKSQMQWPDDLIEIFLSPTSDNELRSILDNLVGECFAIPEVAPIIRTLLYPKAIMETRFNCNEYITKKIECL